MPPVPQEYRDLGAFVRETRRRLGVTQVYVAERASVSNGYICQVERGITKVSDAFLTKLENALELPYGTLFLKVGKPTMDLVKTLLQPTPVTQDPFADATKSEREELIKYLNFLRIKAQLQALPR